MSQQPAGRKRLHTLRCEPVPRNASRRCLPCPTLRHSAGRGTHHLHWRSRRLQRM